MSAIFTAVFSLLSGLPGLLGQYFQKKSELEQIKLEGQIAIQRANIELATKVAESQADLNKAIVRSTGPWFKYFTFTMWFGPFMVGTIRPDLAHSVFTNWESMPDWYIQSCVTIMFTIWGIQVSAPVVGTIFTNLGSYLEGRRGYKLEKKRIQVQDGFKKSWFDFWRKKHGGALSQADVDMVEQAFDYAEQKDQ